MGNIWSCHKTYSPPEFPSLSRLFNGHKVGCKRFHHIQRSTQPFKLMSSCCLHQMFKISRHKNHHNQHAMDCICRKHSCFDPKYPGFQQWNLWSRLPSRTPVAVLALGLRRQGCSPPWHGADHRINPIPLQLYFVAISHWYHIQCFVRLDITNHSYASNYGCVYIYI